MEEYKLSSNVTITGFDDYTHESIPTQYRQGYYILNNKIKDKEYLINESIKYYLDKFSSPKTQAEVLQQIENELQNTSTEIQKICSDFFEFLCDKKILVPNNFDEKIIVAETLYKEGDYIDNLIIEKILSESQHLDIYLAKDKTTETQYVIKLLNIKKTLDEDIFLDELEDLEKEYALLQKVKNIPCICQAYTLQKNKEQAYIVMEYFNGKSLSRFIKDSVTLTQSDYLQIIESILEAFSLIHKNKIIHGDIHSSNVLINEEKGIKIIDLGMSHIMEFDKTEVTIFGGVNSYMPPERINISSLKKYSKEPDFYSDVYQIGLLMYRVLYNTLPFKGFIWEELAANIKEQDIIYPENSFKDFKIPNQLISILQKCLSKKPEDRYKNAAEILADYKKYIVEQKQLFIN